ncbi:MAG: sigma-70 family RNA polymerase sigma factor [Planctomycetota bacterium]
MPDFPETSETLIGRVSDPSDHVAWEAFEQLYRPVIFRIARARGLQHSDALDLVQQVLVSVSGAIGRYESRSDGTRFRHWLSRITRNAILKALSRGAPDRAAGGSDVLDVLSSVANDDDAETQSLIRLEYRRELFRRAADQVRGEVAESTWAAFELTVLQGHPVESTATSLDLSVGSVYAARSRIMRRLRDVVQTLEQWDPEG